MAFSLKLVIAIQVILVSFASARQSHFNTKSSLFDIASARQSRFNTKSSLFERLKLDVKEEEEGGSSSCWDSLFELQSCTSEVVLFFLNGETYLGPGCCSAIRTIEHECWPSMLGTLGYTSEEGDILRGYCDESEPTPGNGGATPIPHQPSSPPPKSGNATSTPVKN